MHDSFHGCFLACDSMPRSQFSWLEMMHMSGSLSDRAGWKWWGCRAPVRVTYRYLEDGTKVRVSTGGNASGSIIPRPAILRERRKPRSLEGMCKSLSCSCVPCGPSGWTRHVSSRTTCLVRLHSSWLREYSWILWDCKFLSLRREFPSGVICAVGTRDTPKEIVLEKTPDPSAGRPGLPQLFQWADELGTNNPFSILIFVLWLRSEPWMVSANSRLREFYKTSLICLKEAALEQN